MKKNLVVTKPFYTLSVGDTFEMNANGDYESVCNDEFSVTTADNTDEVYASLRSNCTLSPSFVDELVEHGYLEAVDTKKDFVNVFDEIDRLLATYTEDLENLDEENLPACVKLEKETVLNNMVKVLNHLGSLKK